MTIPVSLTSLDEPILLDRRRLPRERILQRAEILIGNGVHACILLDLTPRGARLELPVTLIVPDRFTLRFADGRQAVCERRWAVGRRVGVEILHAEALAGSLTERAAAILRLAESAPAERTFAALRAEHFLHNPSVADSCWQAEAAWKHLRTALQHVAVPPDDADRQAPAR